MADNKKSWFSRHKILTAILAFIVLGVVVSASSGGTDTANDSSDKSNPSKTEDAKSEATVAKIGEPARDGKFEFTISGVECGKTQLGNQYINTKAQGEFCLVDVAVKNIGDEAQFLFDDNQYAFNADGQKYSADSGAAVYLDDSASKIFEEINPGNSVKGKIIFDVPKGTKLTSLELHDSAFSGGVKVNL